MTTIGRAVATSAPTIGGVDEAGRGPLAGPVIAAVVVLREGQHIDGVGDSKRIPAPRRVSLARIIRREAVAWAIGRAEVAEIDTLNILGATLLAMRRAVDALSRAPDLLRIDGNRAPALPRFRGGIETLIGGDNLCQAIGAASILAKVHRDDEMRALDAHFPGYGFAQHKGYATREHREALCRLGPCRVHRRSFRAVREAADMMFR